MHELALSLRLTDKGDDSKIHWQRDVEVSFPSSIGVPGVEERRDDCQDVWRHCEKERDDIGVPESLDDGWKQVRDRS